MGGISHINFLKIDVEGHELYVLKGLGRYLDAKFIDIIQFEYGGTNFDSKINLKDFFDLLELNNFVIHKIMPRHLEPKVYKPEYENFLYSNFVAISKDFLNDRIKTYSL